MPVTIEIHVGTLASARAEIAARLEHVLAEKSGNWYVSITASSDSGEWQMKIAGPNEFERSYILEESSGEHHPFTIGRIVSQMVSRA